MAAAKIRDNSGDDSSLSGFLETLSESARNSFKSIFNKVRGIADFRRSVIYVRADTGPRVLFAKSHELAHHDIPWHKISGGEKGYLHDDDYTLSPQVKELFEQEANYYAADLIFRGKRFINLARSVRPSFLAIFQLSAQHGASNQATLRRFVESQDELVASVCYLPSKLNFSMETGLGVLNAPRLVGSPNFIARFGDIILPMELDDEHPWAVARGAIDIPEGHIELECSGAAVNFWWQAWWNNYSLHVMLRREPRFKIIGESLRHVAERFK
ncbi:MAG: hypothetical protein WKF34_07070 [Pyrinomonadaceae bacterium]